MSVGATVRTGTVLVVEDEADLRLVVEALLGIEGFTVVSVGSAEEALPHLEEVDAILLDIRLPGISGLELVDRMPKATRRKVLFMSAHADMEHSDLVTSTGCAGFLVKPFDFDDMRDRLAELLASS